MIISIDAEKAFDKNSTYHLFYIPLSKASLLSFFICIIPTLSEHEMYIFYSFLYYFCVIFLSYDQLCLSCSTTILKPRVLLPNFCYLCHSLMKFILQQIAEKGLMAKEFLNFYMTKIIFLQLWHLKDSLAFWFTVSFLELFLAFYSAFARVIAVCFTFDLISLKL